MGINRHGQMEFTASVASRGILPECPDDHSTGSHQSRYEKFAQFWKSGVPAYTTITK